jgi:hypothetical protein
MVGSRPFWPGTGTDHDKNHSPQDGHQLKVLRQFLNDYLGSIPCHGTGMNSRLAYNIDENECSDWGEWRNYEGNIPVELANGRIHFGVSRRIKYQTMLVCINANGETLCRLIATTN